MEQLTQHCSMCHQTKALEEFVKNKQTASGRANRCLDCHRTGARIYKREKTGKGVGSPSDQADRKAVEQWKKWYERQKLDKMCGGCGVNPAEEGKVRCSDCLKQRRESYYKNRDLFIKGGFCKRCGKEDPLDMGYCLDCYTFEKSRGALRVRLQKQRILAMYGDSCTCCGEKEPLLLTIDHVNNDGAAERRSLGDKGRSGAYTRYLSQPKRDDLQTLCWSCNMGKQLNKGVCPHQKA